MSNHDAHLAQAQKIVHDEWQLTDATIEWLSFTHNAVFDVSHNNLAYVLKMVSTKAPQAHNPVAREYRLLSRLSELGDSIPRIVRQDDESPYVAHSADSIVYAVLYHKYVGSSPTNETITPAIMRKLGTWLGHFHNTQPDLTGLPLIHLDWDGLFADTGIYYPGDENMGVFTPEQHTIIAAVTERVRLAMQAIGQAEAQFGLIHGDLLLKNILLDDDSNLRILDFEYCGRGYYLYDLTPSLWQLKPHPDYARFASALWDAYLQARPQAAPHHHWLETLIAARQVASMRWVAANQQNPYVVGKVEHILAQRTAELDDFLTSGILTRA